jgi:hypothetical protein
MGKNEFVCPCCIHDKIKDYSKVKRLQTKQSRKKITELRNKGYKIKKVLLPNGDIMVLKRKSFVSRK